MKTLLLINVLVMLAFADHDSFRHMLENIRGSDHFEDMSEDEQLILSELIMAAEESPAAVTHYIDRVSLDKVLRFLNDLEGTDAVYIEQYLAHKRQKSDLYSYLEELEDIYKISQHLSPADKNHLKAIMDAAHNNTLTQYIDNEGYGPLFQILSHVESKHNDDFIDILTKHLEKEAAMTGTSV